MVNFGQNFRRISMVDALEEKLGVTLGVLTENSKGMLEELCKKKGIEFETPSSTAQLFDDLVSNLIEPECKQPTFLIDHPIITSPLARLHRTKVGWLIGVAQ